MNCAVNSPTGNKDARNQIHLHKKIIYFYAIYMNTKNVKAHQK